MPLTSLPLTSLQLVMHGLTAREILAFARCSRETFHAADAPFAFAHSTLAIDSMTLLAAPLSCPLLRHIPLVVTLRPPPHRSTTSEVSRDGHLAALASRAFRIVELNAVGCLMTLPQWSRMLSAPRIRSSLRTLLLALDREDDHIEIVKCISALQTLTSLSLYLSYCINVDLGVLVTCPLLSTLSLTFHQGSASTSLLQLAECRSITALTIRETNLISETALIQAIARCLFIPQLQSLSLDYLSFDPLHAQEWAALFAALTSLESLTLRYVQPDVPLLPYLSAARRLRSLRLLCCIHGTQLSFAEALPPTESIVDLLMRCPLLHLTMGTRPAGSKPLEWPQQWNRFGDRCRWIQ